MLTYVFGIIVAAAVLAAWYCLAAAGLRSGDRPGDCLVSASLRAAAQPDEPRPEIVVTVTNPAGGCGCTGCGSARAGTRPPDTASCVPPVCCPEDWPNPLGRREGGVR